MALQGDVNLMEAGALYVSSDSESASGLPADGAAASGLADSAAASGASVLSPDAASGLPSEPGAGPAMDVRRLIAIAMSVQGSAQNVADVDLMEAGAPCTQGGYPLQRVRVCRALDSQPDHRLAFCIGSHAA